MVQDTITLTINNVFKELDVTFVDDTTYKKLENMSSQYKYIDNDLLEQMIEAELIIMLERDNWYWYLIEIIIKITAICWLSSFISAEMAQTYPIALAVCNGIRFENGQLTINKDWDNPIDLNKYPLYVLLVKKTLLIWLKQQMQVLREYF